MTIFAVNVACKLFSCVIVLVVSANASNPLGTAAMTNCKDTEKVQARHHVNCLRCEIVANGSGGFLHLITVT